VVGVVVDYIGMIGCGNGYLDILWIDSYVFYLYLNGMGVFIMVELKVYNI
jgi:hypothetical protein